MRGTEYNNTCHSQPLINLSLIIVAINLGNWKIFGGTYNKLKNDTSMMNFIMNLS